MVDSDPRHWQARATPGRRDKLLLSLNNYFITVTAWSWLKSIGSGSWIVYELDHSSMCHPHWTYPGDTSNSACWRQWQTLSLDSWAQQVYYLIIIWKYKSICFSPQIWFAPFSLALRPTPTILQRFNKIKTKFSLALKWNVGNQAGAMLGFSLVHALQQRIFANINIY